MAMMPRSQLFFLPTPATLEPCGSLENSVRPKLTSLVASGSQPTRRQPQKPYPTTRETRLVGWREHLVARERRGQQSAKSKNGK